MTEPAVALTDYAVALECIVLIFFLPAGGFRADVLRFWFTVFLSSICAASVCGGTVHGFFLDDRTLGYAVLWPATLLVMGVTALAMWAIAAHLLLPQRVRWMLVVGGIQYVLYSITVLFLVQEFWVAMADNLPAILFLMLALGVTYHREKHWQLLLAAAGPAMVLIAAVLQYLRVGLDPVYFDYNALYHVLQGVAIFLLFQGMRWSLGTQRLPKMTGVAR